MDVTSVHNRSQPEQRTRDPTSSLVTRLEEIKREHTTRSVYQKVIVNGELDDLFMNGHSPTADVTISCGASKWGAHKVVLTARCPFFKACLSSSSGYKEAISSTVEFDEDELLVCQTFLEYLYSKSLLQQCCFWKHQDSDSPELVASVYQLESLIQMAHKYGVPSLFLSMADLLDRDITFDGYETDEFDALVYLFVATAKYDDYAEMLFLQEKLLELMNNKKIEGDSHSDHVKAMIAGNPDLAICLYLQTTPVEVSKLAFARKRMTERSSDEQDWAGGW